MIIQQSNGPVKFNVAWGTFSFSVCLCIQIQTKCSICNIIAVNINIWDKNFFYSIQFYLYSAQLEQLTYDTFHTEQV